MVYVLLGYGLAFVVTGAVLGLQARSPGGVLPQPCLALLALFGLVHGSAEWVHMAGAITGTTAPLLWTAFTLTGVSFLLLLQFGVEMRIRRRVWRSRTRVLPVGLLAISAGTLAVTRQVDGLPASDALVRYLIGLPASLVAAVVLIAEARHPSRATQTQRASRLILSAGVAFAFYALFTGVLVPRARLPPASIVNVETFRRATGVPVQLPRAACALTIAVLLSEAFVAEENRRKEALQRLRVDAISAVAHDLRGPIHAIRLTTTLLDESLRDVPGCEPVHAIGARIAASTRSLERMVADLLDASLVESRRLVMRKEHVDLLRLLEDIVARTDLGEHVVHVHASRLPPVDVDPVRIEQVMANLLSNAAKYSDPDTDIAISAKPRNGWVRVSVTNVGPGIAADELDRIFEPFYRAKEAGSRATGLGLGLFVTKALVEAHGGRIWVQSDPRARKTTFHVVLPASSSE